MDWKCGPSSRALLCKHEAKNSNPSPTKKIKRLIQIILYRNSQKLHNLKKFSKSHSKYIYYLSLVIQMVDFWTMYF
jgi:hypothetical protein